MRLFVLCVLVTIQVHLVISIIPEECAKAVNLRNKECCPNNCGGDRGQCMDVTGDVGYSPGPANDIRYQWPLRLFRKVCKCNDNYGGVDCNGCKFGYKISLGKCVKQLIRTRRSLSNMTAADWASYRDTLNKTKYTKSRYFVITQSFPSVISNQTSDDDLLSSIVRPNLYDLFIWIHHFVAKDSEANGVDFAHEFTGFLTWHRLFLLWVEREIRETIYDDDFVLHYWNWTDIDEREKYFKSGYLNINEPPFNQWPVFCWYEGTIKQMICNATEPVTSNSSPVILRRCPKGCSKDNTAWPSTFDVNSATRMSSYDTSGFDKNAKNSFRNYLEGFVPVDSCHSRSLCKDNLQRKLHNTVHLLLGPGDFETSYTDSLYYDQGVMGDVAASPNDPIFFNHHTMIDCIMEEWINGNGKYLAYPTSTEIREGHRGDDYIVPFLPLYKHEQLLLRSKVFGYTCDFGQDENNDFYDEQAGGSVFGAIFGGIVGLAIMAGFIGTVVFIYYKIGKYCARKSTKR